MMYRLPIWLPVAVLLQACSTYHYSSDPYIAGVRSFDSKDFELAKRKWEPLASDGDCDAQYRMGILYFLGAGVPQDYKAAHEWWVTAANQGQAQAQMLLAITYAHDNMTIGTMGSTTWLDCEKGCGYERDALVAYQWMKLAEKLTPYESGQRYAREKSVEYRKLLTQQEGSAAYGYLQVWIAKPVQCKQREIVEL